MLSRREIAAHARWPASSGRPGWGPPIREFRRRGTLLYVSHDAPSVKGLCDRGLWLADYHAPGPVVPMKA